MANGMKLIKVHVRDISGGKTPFLVNTQYIRLVDGIDYNRHKSRISLVDEDIDVIETIDQIKALADA